MFKVTNVKAAIVIGMEPTVHMVRIDLTTKMDACGKENIKIEEKEKNQPAQVFMCRNQGTPKSVSWYGINFRN